MHRINVITKSSLRVVSSKPIKKLTAISPKKYKFCSSL